MAGVEITLYDPFDPGVAVMESMCKHACFAGIILQRFLPIFVSCVSNHDRIQKHIEFSESCGNGLTVLLMTKVESSDTKHVSINSGTVTA